MIYIALGTAIRRVRLKRNYSVDGVARMAGITHSHWTKIECERRTPTLGTLQNMACALSVSVWQLLKLAEEIEYGVVELESPTVSNIPLPFRCTLYNDFLPELGGILRKARLAKGYSLTEAARRAAISRAFWSNVEYGRRTPRIATLLSMAEVVGIPAYKLVKQAEGA